MFYTAGMRHVVKEKSGEDDAGDAVKECAACDVKPWTHIDTALKKRIDCGNDEDKELRNGVNNEIARELFIHGFFYKRGKDSCKVADG